MGGDSEEGFTYKGIPAKKGKPISEVKNHITGEEAYPWPLHFDRGMPWEKETFEEWSNS